MSGNEKTLREIAGELKSGGMGCNCDLDNWEPEASTGHSHMCRIHKRAMQIKHQQQIDRVEEDSEWANSQMTVGEEQDFGA